MIRVTVWNEFYHEKTEKEVQERHPNGLHNTIAAILRTDEELVVRTATLDDPDCGLSEEVLNETDVLFWWSHILQDNVPDEVVERVQSHVLSGMGLVVLHSGHFSKIFRRLCGSSGTLKWHDNARERIFTVNPAHPIAKGVSEYFEIPQEEVYCEPFGIPEPDELVFLGWYNTGEVFRSGCCFYRGNGRIFYFQPGHETDAAFDCSDVHTVLRNAAHWAAPRIRTPKLECAWAAPLEDVAE